MDRDTVPDRLPFGRIPGLGTDTDETDEQPDSDTGSVDSDDVDAADTDTTDTDAADTDLDIETDSVEIDIDESEDAPSRRDSVRKVLLGVSLGGLGLAALAALLWRLLGGSDGDSEDEADSEDEPVSGAADAEQSPDDDAAEPDSETPAPEDEVDIASELLTADAEGVAALVGLGFHLLVRALVGEDESESSTA